MAIVGAVDSGVSDQGIKPMLGGIGEDKIVTVFNPLTDDFQFKHSRSVAQAVPLTREAQVAEEKGGLSMRKEQGSVGHYAQFWVLEAGKSKKLPGDIAQKAVQDLTTYILMHRAGKGRPKMVADAFARSEVEKEIILSVEDSVNVLNTISADEYSKKQVESLNRENKSIEEPPNPPPGQGVSFATKPTAGRTPK